MKTQILSVAFLATIALTGCSGNSSKDGLLADAKNAAELECKKKEAMQSFRKGNISALDEETKLSEQLSLLKKKYQDDDKLQLKFLDAMAQEMSNCQVEEVEEETIITTSSPSVFSETDNEDWDKMLDDFEAYVDEYVKIYKKALSGDNEAFYAYPELLEKAGNLEKA